MTEVRYQDTLVSSRKDHKLAYSRDIYDLESDKSMDEQMKDLEAAESKRQEAYEAAERARQEAYEKAEHERGMMKALTQEEYDQLVEEGKVDDNTYYNIFEE